MGKTRLTRPSLWKFRTLETKAKILQNSGKQTNHMWGSRNQHGFSHFLIAQWNCEDNGEILLKVLKKWFLTWNFMPGHFQTCKTSDFPSSFLKKILNYVFNKNDCKAREKFWRAQFLDYRKQELWPKNCCSAWQLYPKSSNVTEDDWMDGQACCGLAQSQTRLKRLSSSSSNTRKEPLPILPALKPTECPEPFNICWFSFHSTWQVYFGLPYSWELLGGSSEQNKHRKARYMCPYSYYTSNA